MLPCVLAALACPACPAPGLPGGGTAGWWAGRRASPWFGAFRRLVFIGRFGLFSSCLFLVLTGPLGP
eukprot:12547559-Alexandrium_andersonii.AAC.1